MSEPIAHRALGWNFTLPHRFSVGNFPQERDLTRQIAATELVGATSTRGHSNALKRSRALSLRLLKAYSKEACDVWSIRIFPRDVRQCP